jgi:VanZ family protein
MVLLPVAIELTQVLIPGRECSVSDWLANSLGGLIGVAVGWLTQRWLRARKAARPGAPPTPQPDALTNS